MPSIFDGLDEIVDSFLHLDENWEGEPPWYRHRATLNRLCLKPFCDLDGLGLVHRLYDQILESWNQHAPERLPSVQNWRFEKRLNFTDNKNKPEVILERTIASVVDANWANQVPVDFGLLSPDGCHMDLVFRAGSNFTMTELKCTSNTPLSAAIQILKYGLAYAFSRSHAELLGINLDSSPLLQASELHLNVLAPHKYYEAYGPDRSWLAQFEKAIHQGVERFSEEITEPLPRMSFGFEAFPKDFVWTLETAREDCTKKEVLWAIHRRMSLWTTNPPLFR